MRKADSAHPTPITVPVRQEEKIAGSPAQQAFRQAILDVENLRERLRDLRAQQAETRRRYWQQVGPAATAVVAARRALFPALEEALLLEACASERLFGGRARLLRKLLKGPQELGKPAWAEGASARTNSRPTVNVPPRAISCIRIRRSPELGTMAVSEARRHVEFCKA